MRRIIGMAFVSLDGVMQAPGGPNEDPTGGFELGGWLPAVDDEALGNQIMTYFSRPFDLLLGRRTWEIFAAHWPFMTDNGPITTSFRDCRKYVLTRSDIALDWAGSERIPDLETLAELKQGEGPDLLIQGSSTLYPQLLERGLIDRLVLLVAPLLLGSGKKLFGDGTPAGRWMLVEQRTGSGGMAIGTYDRAGPVETGSFEVPELNPREIARREKLQREG
ncbi:dihydrofolate reductase family protein [Sphingomonas sp. M1-B02]|uniref:dihydrofolate reductase family protein n=1 Tax=Sphingomonas sp. M1-B02 TaxID=3114300 RepID=UPI0022400008|nr:dihydrofolate reductase family protein [Sphingomonas sp. S6-11]UZK64743.1 dihydrofolate reductase family protein [Sphingomonas sp. S6-11]